MKTQREKILAIDDTPSNLITLGAALDCEYELQFATSGPMGIALAIENPPNLILLDVMMPEVDGYETFRRLAAHPKLKDIPVIFVTALDDFDSEVAGLQLGVADYITKPIKVPIARQRIRNLLEREHLRKEVQLQRDHLRKLSIAVEQSPASVVITDLYACIEYVNPKFSEVTGYSKPEAIGQNMRILNSSQTPKETYVTMWQQLTSGKVWKCDFINRRKNGEIYWEETHIAPVKNLAGAVTHYVAVKNDITDRKNLEAQVHQLAFHDPLTQLANRRLLEDRLRQTVAASRRSACYCALMLLDLDNFKPLNDQHGHMVGDLLLIEVSKRLTACVREVDTVARFGGDEFIVLLGGLDTNKMEATAQAAAIAEKIRNSLALPYTLTVTHEATAQTSTIEHHCSASIGVVVFIDPNESQDNILKWADAAMYQAKQAGRNSVRIYDSNGLSEQKNE